VAQVNRRPSARLVAVAALGVLGLGGVVTAISLPTTVNLTTRVGIVMVAAGLAGGLLVLFQVTRSATWAARGTDQRLRELRKEVGALRSGVENLARAQPSGGLSADELAAERREIVRQVDARLLGLFELLAPAQDVQDDRGDRGDRDDAGARDGPVGRDEQDEDPGRGQDRRW
jgi:hypothetical protein